MFFGKKGKQDQEELLALLLECQDRCLKTDLESVCKEIRRNIDGNVFGKDSIRDLRSILGEAREELKRRNLNTAGVCLDRAFWLSRAAEAGKAGDWRMGLFGRIKEIAGRHEQDSQTKMLGLEGKEAEQRVYELEKKIASLYDSHSELTRQLEEKVKQCSALNKNDNAYLKLRQQAMALMPRIRSLEKQIHMHIKMLESSSRYQAMIEMGNSAFELQKFMPDISRAEAMMEWIAGKTQDVSESMEDLSSGIDQYEAEISMAAAGEADGSAEFDDRVAKVRSEAVPEAETEPAEAQDPAEAG